jgi:hypothetical protein
LIVVSNDDIFQKIKELFPKLQEMIFKTGKE